VPDAIALPISLVQLELLNNFTVFPLETPATLIVGVKSKPEEVSGSTKTSDVGAEGTEGRVTPPSLDFSSPLQEKRRVHKQKIKVNLGAGK
jgi:hypothetical protein